MKNISCGGAFVDIGVHMVDALVWLMGNPKIKSVCASLGRNHQCEIGSLRGSGDLAGEVKNAIPFDPAEMDVEDFACGRLNFENGASVNFKVAWASNMPEASDIRLVSKKAGLDIPACKIYTGEHGEETLKTVPLQYMSPFAGHIYLADNLLKAMKGRTEPFVRPAETLNVARILELFYQSAEAGREVFANEA